MALPNLWESWEERGLSENQEWGTCDMMTFAVLHFCIFNFADFISIACKIILNTILIIIIVTAVFES